jgi:hypothetical protein
MKVFWRKNEDSYTREEDCGCTRIWRRDPEPHIFVAPCRGHGGGRWEIEPWDLTRDPPEELEGHYQAYKKRQSAAR